MSLAQSTIDLLLRPYKGDGFDIEYWAGSKKHYGDNQHRFSIVFKTKAIVKQVLNDPMMGFAEGYMSGDIEVEGDLRDVIKMAGKIQDSFSRWSEIQQKYFSWLKRARPASIKQQQKDIANHYDLGNKFFSLWLDKTMTYSCAYFKNEDDSLERAQHNKNDYVLKKSMVKKGETILDIGSGWGDLILLAAKKYHARATGIALAQAQVTKTRARIKHEGLTGHVNVHYLDYRELPSLKQTFDKIVSVGMYEHVGKDNASKFFDIIKKVLDPQGVMVLHTIGRIENIPANPWLRKYIFPGGYLPSLQEVFDQLATYHFQLVDVENLRIHYAKTLDHWAENYEKNYDKVVAMYGQRFARMWRLYLYVAAASFRYLGTQVYQIVFINGLRNDLPLTRAHLYK